MRIAHFTETYLPIPDGVAVHIATLIKYIKKMGHSYDLIAPVRHRDVTVPFFSVPFLPYSHYRVAILSPWKIWRILKINADVSHIHTPFMVGALGRFFARKKDIGCVATYHTDFINMAESIQFLLKHFFVKIAYKYNMDLYRKCDLVIAPTEIIGKRLRKEGLNVRVLRHCIDTEYIDSLPQKDVFKKFGLNKNKPLVLFVGRLTKDKGVYTILEAAKKVMEAQFVIAGTGPEENRLRKFSRYLDNVKILGWVSDADKFSLMRVAEIFLLPSKAETFGLTILEAQYCRCAVIASRAGAIPEVLGNRGLLVEFGNSEELANAIYKLLEDEDLRNKLIYAGRNFVEKEGNFKIYTEKIMKVYEEISS